MTPVDDLAAWLTQIWDEQEKIAQGVVDRSAPDEATIYLEDPWPEEAAYLPHIKPASVLARIAADRQILADYRYYEADYRANPTPTLEGQRFGLLLALTRLAEAYADRPGFREEWRA